MNFLKENPISVDATIKGHFWSPGKFCRTVGNADVETVINYVREYRFQQVTLDRFSSPAQPTT